MIVDERSYILKTGHLRPFLELYRSRGYPAQRRHLGEPFGLFSVEVGELDTWVHMWSYTDVTDRARRRAALARDRDWLTFQRDSAQHIAGRRNRLLEGIELGAE